MVAQQVLRKLALAFALVVALALPAGYARATAIEAAPASTETATTSLPLPVVVRSGHVTVLAERGLKPLAADLAREAPQILAEIHTDLPDLPKVDTVQIRLVKNAGDLGRAAPPGYRVPPWAEGVAFPRERVVAIAQSRGPDPVNARATLAHELAHVALYVATGGRAPRWLSEGFAYLHSPELSQARVRTLVGIAWGGEVIPLGRLASGFPAQEAPAHRAYAQSYDFVTYLARRGRHLDSGDDGDRWAFRRFLAELAAGKRADGAAREAYGQGLDKLWDEWLASVRERYFLAPVGLFSLAVWAFGALLLCAAFVRKRRQGKRTLDRWALDEGSGERDDAPDHSEAQWLH